MTAQPTAPGASRTAFSGRVGELLFAAAVLSLGVTGFLAGAGIQTPPSASDIGPRAFPYLVSGLLVLVGAALIFQVLRGRTGDAEEGEDIDPDVPTDWTALAKLAGFLVLHIVLITPLGWPIAAAVLFFGVSWSLGAASWARSLLIGVVLALLLQIGFAGLLGVSLPAGILQGVPFLNG
ncbi:tripartite tricarboxylate transporter TctB family protein [Arthrobacter sp. 7Tela_A1]|uniref:tripartite tricarboxylate transporter TctB family protein n=1 Tax=Arthrobacter sp. 7Tela_A1 TaxID=3093745 RepID=UPI003BB6FF0B